MDEKRPPGRPRVPKTEALSAGIHVRCTAAEMKSVAKRAKAAGQSVSEYIRDLIREDKK